MTPEIDVDTLDIRAANAELEPRSAEKRVAWVQLAGGATTPVHEGDQVGSYRVREIEPAAVVFDDGGAEIRRNVGAR